MTYKSVVLTVGGGNSLSKDRCKASGTETILTICILNGLWDCRSRTWVG